MLTFDMIKLDYLIHPSVYPSVTSVYASMLYYGLRYTLVPLVIIASASASQGEGAFNRCTLPLSNQPWVESLAILQDFKAEFPKWRDTHLVDVRALGPVLGLAGRGCASSTL